MNCKKGWDRVVLFNILPRAFVLGDFKRHRESILFEREQGLMPATQPEVVFERVRREVVSLKRGFAAEARAAAMAACIRFHYPLEFHQVEEYWTKYQAQYYGNRLQDLSGSKAKTKPKLVHKCPSTRCKGFLNTKWHCDLCTKDICKACNEEKVPNHECNPDTVETVKLIRSDTKGCPTCGTLIYRSSGCPQVRRLGLCPNRIINVRL